MKRRVLLKMGLYLSAMGLPLTSMASENVTSKMTMPETQVIIVFSVKKEKLVSFLKIIEDVKKKLPLVLGCNGVAVYQNKDDMHCITLVERWESMEKHKNHIKHVVDSGDWKYISSHLAEEPQSNYYHEL